MEQSLQFRQAFAQSPLVQECESQMNNLGNNLLSACRNAIDTASRLDQHNFKLKYNNIPLPALRKIYRVYTVIRHLLYPYFTENVLPSNPPQNEVQISVKMNENSNALSVNIKAPIMDVIFTNVRLSPLETSLFQLNPNSKALERLGKQFSPLFSQRKFTLASMLIFGITIIKVALMLNSLQGIYRIHVSIILQKGDFINITRIRLVRGW